MIKSLLLPLTTNTITTYSLLPSSHQISIHHLHSLLLQRLTLFYPTSSLSSSSSHLQLHCPVLLTNHHVTTPEQARLFIHQLLDLLPLTSFSPFNQPLAILRQTSSLRELSLLLALSSLSLLFFSPSAYSFFSLALPPSLLFLPYFYGIAGAPGLVG